MAPAYVLICLILVPNASQGTSTKHMEGCAGLSKKCHLTPLPTKMLENVAGSKKLYTVSPDSAKCIKCALCERDYLWRAQGASGEFSKWFFVCRGLAVFLLFLFAQGRGSGPAAGLLPSYLQLPPRPLMHMHWPASWFCCHALDTMLTDTANLLATTYIHKPSWMSCPTEPLVWVADFISCQSYLEFFFSVHFFVDHCVCVCMCVCARVRLCMCAQTNKSHICLVLFREK